MFALYLLCHYQETPGKQRPHSWELFGYFKLVMMSRNLSRGVFCFLTCSSIWNFDMAPRFLLSFTILISLFLSLPLTPHSRSFYFYLAIESRAEGGLRGESQTATSQGPRE